MTSEMMNHIIPMRNDLSTCRLNRPFSFSLMTVANQPANRNARPSAPGMKAQPPAQSFRKLTTPNISTNSVSEPTMGHGLLCGT